MLFPVLAAPYMGVPGHMIPAVDAQELERVYIALDISRHNRRYTAGAAKPLSGCGDKLFLPRQLLHFFLQLTFERHENVSVIASLFRNAKQ